MKCDLDLIREIMLIAEEEVDRPLRVNVLFLQDTLQGSRSAAEIQAHLRMLASAGFIETRQAVLVGVLGVSRITWKGYRVLDIMRDYDLWHKAREKSGTGPFWLAQEMLQRAVASGREDAENEN